MSDDKLRPPGPPKKGSGTMPAIGKVPSPVPPPPPTVPPSSTDVEDKVTSTLKGIAGSPGVAVGPALVLGDIRTAYVRRHVQPAQVEAEIERLHQSVLTAKNTLREVAGRVPGAGREQTTILDAYLAMLGDPTLLERVEKKVRRERLCAEWAVAAASEEIARMFKPATDEKDAYIVERRHDIEFVCDRLLRALVGETQHAIPRLEEPMVIVARDLSPADTAGMVREPAIAFVTEIGTRTSHTSIMARALEIPAVVGAQGALEHIRTGDVIIVDGLRGEIVVHPTQASIDDARTRAARHLAFARGLLSARDRPSVTPDR
jgi:phosphotransferase system enzyme I (PtsI)